MLYDRIKWHFDPDIRWNDPDAARSFIPAPKPGVRAATSFRYDLTDHAEFQRPDPQWTPPPGLRGMVVRCTDGTYREPVFATHFRTMDALLQQGKLDYCMWYVLPSPNVSNQQMIDAIAGQMRDSGVAWGRPGHGWSIDDEPTPFHGQVTDKPGSTRMTDLRNALQDIYQREELHYVGLYNGNYGFISNQGWKLWAPWPTGNGALPPWTTNLVMQQWGVAGPGEVPGFPNAPVDVDHIWDQATLDALTGRTPKEEDFLSALSDQEQLAIRDQLAVLTSTVTGATWSGTPRLIEMEARVNALWDAITGATSEGDARWVVEEARITDTWKNVAAIRAKLADLNSPAVDVDALAKALAPLLNSGSAVAVADLLGERLSTGGTPSGST